MTRNVLLAVGTAVAVILLVLISMPSLGLSGLILLDGPITVEAWHRGEPLGDKEIQLPGLFGREDLPSDARVRARWAIHVPPDAPESAWAVWLERPQFAARVHWDAVEVGHSGEVDGTSRSERSILAVLPLDESWQGPHELQIDVQGDYNRGGVIGRMVIGPSEQVVRFATIVEAERLGLVLLLASLGLVQVLLASGGRPRQANLFFGAVCLLLAAYLFGRPELAASLLPEPEGPIRLRRVVTAFIMPLGLGLATTFDHKPIPSWLWGLLGLSAALSLGGILLPMGWLPTLEAILDGGLVLGVVILPLLVLPLALRRRPGAVALAFATVVPLVLGVLLEIAVTNGLISGSTGLGPAITAFAVGVTAALSMRDVTAGERHVQLVRGSPDALLGVSPAGIVTDANPAAERLLGRSPLGTRLLDWIVADDQRLLQAQLARTPNRPARAELRVRGQDRVLESVVTPLDDHTMVILLRDVTARQDQAQVRIQDARMETLALLVGGLAHDFNNMLGTLLAHVGFLQLTTQGQATVEARLSRMEATLVRASALNRRLLTLAGGSSSPLVATSLSEVVRSAADLVEPTLPERVVLRLDVPAGLPEVAASPADLEHVFVNLIVNARKAVGLKGEIRVIARPFASKDAIGVLCAVEDSGPGVPIDMQEKIFAPFVTGSSEDSPTAMGPDGGGTGLGLAVARQVVREHQGRIWVENQPGGGARFCIALHDARVLAHAGDTEIPPGSHVLVVEDEDGQRETWESALTRTGCRVQAFAEPQQAIAALEYEEPDLLVTDLLLPGIDGVQLARLARDRYPTLPILLVSAHLPPKDQLADLGGLTTLSKPVRLSSLLTAVAHLLSAEDGELPDTTPMVAPSLEDVRWETARWNSPTPAPPMRQGRPEE